MKYISIIILLLSLTGILPASAYNIRQINSRDGLSNSAVICLHQDSEHYLWIGTYDGLNKYNGADIEIYKPDINYKQSLSGNVIRKIVESKDDYLWIMTKWGLDKYSKKRDKVEAHFDEFREDCSMACDSKGNVFILTETGNFYMYDFTENNFNEIVFAIPQSYNNWSSLLIDDYDKIWIRNRGTVKQFTIDKPDGSYPQLVEEAIFDYQEPIIYTYYDKGSLIIIDRKGDLFVVKGNEKIFIKNISSILSTYGDITSILFDDNDIFIGFSTSGLVRLDHKKEYEMEKMPISCGVFCLLKDDVQDIIWVGTDGQGLYACMKEGYIFNGINLDELPINMQRPIRAIYADHNNDLWLGTKGNGIIRIKDFDNTTEYNLSNVDHFTNENGLSNNAIIAFEMSTRNNVLWIGSNGPDLNYYSYEDKKIHTLTNKNSIRFINVHSLLETSDSILWVTSVNHLLKVNIQKNKNLIEVKNIRKYEFDIKNKQSFNPIFSISPENDSIMWLAMRGNGAIRLNHTTGNYQLGTFDEKGIAPMNDVLSICLDKKGNNWFGSSYGLNNVKVLPNGKFDYLNFNESDGLLNNTIHGVLENQDGKLWLSTNTGITLFDPVEETCRNFNQKTGLKVIEFSDNAYFKDEKKSRYFFGGVDGVIWIKPDEKINKDFIPPVYFTKLRVFNEEFNINDFLVEKEKKSYLKLRYDQNFFSVSFIANDFINGMNGKYSYKLDNFSEVWMDAGSSEAQFTNIPPGKYVLQVKYYGTNASDNHTASLNILILPPWYLNIYAKIAYAIAGICFLIFLILYFKKKYEGKQLKLEKELDQKYKDEMYEGKLRFFTNITHEFCTPLTLIHIPNERILNYEGSDSFIKKYAGIIKSNTEKLNNLIQDVIDFRRMETGNKICKITSCNINKTCVEIVESFTDLAEENQINFSLSISSTIRWNTDHSCITKILNNLISNSFKYTPRNGIINVTVYTENQELILKIYNTGKGIEEKDIPYIFNRYSVLDNVETNSIKGLSSRNGLGLAICKSMVDLLGGSIDVKSEVGKYAEFIVKLPVGVPDNSEYAELVEPGNSIINTNSLSPYNKELFSSKNNESETEAFSHNPENQPSILIVDDNEDILSILNDLLSDEYTILTAKDGNEGFNKLRDLTPELVITDVMMPNCDGISFIKRIKGDSHLMHIPLVIISAKSAVYDKINGIESGADAYITKPFDAQYLKTVIKGLIEKKRSLREYYNSSASAYDYLNGQLLAKEDRDFVKTAVDIIEKNITNIEFSPEDLANELQMSMRSLYRKFKELDLLPPKDFIKEQRITYAAKLIVRTNLTIQEIMYDSGFTTRSHFYKEFTKRYNQSPKEYRENQNITNFD